MATKPYPLAMPDDLLTEVQSAASETQLSVADVMRQSMRLGLGKLREQLRAESGLKPFTAAERKAAFAPDPDWDKTEAALARHATSKIRQPDFD